MKLSLLIILSLSCVLVRTQDRSSPPQCKLQEKEVDYQEDYRILTEGLTWVNCTSYYQSDIILFGENTFPVVLNQRGVPFAGGVKYGEGKVLVLPRQNYLFPGNRSPTVTKLVHNAVKWMSSKESPKIATSDSRIFIDHEETETRVKPADLLNRTDIDVYVQNAHAYVTDKGVEGLVEFVKRGGGLITGGQAWSYRRGIRELHFNGNKFLNKLGVAISAYAYKRTLFKVADFPPLESSLYYALNDIESDIGRMVFYRFVTRLLRKDTVQLPIFQPLYQKALAAYKHMANCSETDPFVNYNIVLLDIIMSRPDTTSDDIPAAIDVESFPGKVPDDAQDYTATLSLDGSYEGLNSQFMYAGSGKHHKLSTGMYARPGQIVTVTFPSHAVNKNIQVSIGAHIDNLRWRPKNRRYRSLQIVFGGFKVEQETVRAVNPWGGPVYVLVPPYATVGMMNVTIEGAVRAPYFVLGKHTDEDWHNEIKHYPGPWAEIEAPHKMIISISSSVARSGLQEPTKLMNVYSNITTKLDLFAGIKDGYRQRARRIVFDKMISNGHMHAGYPIMSLGNGKWSLAVDSVSHGPWGLLHEFGHNLQWRSWTTGPIIEVTVNIYAYYARAVILGLPKPVSDHVDPGWMERATREFVKDGRPRGDWFASKAFATYFFLIESLGWETMHNVILKYWDIPVIYDPNRRLDVFARTYSDVSGLDLCSYFEWYRYPITEETREVCRRGAKFENNPLKRFDPDYPF